MTPSDMARKRWRGTTKAQRSEACRAAVCARWRKYREKQAQK